MKKLFLLSVLALLTSFLNAQTHWTPVDPEGSTGLTATIIGVVQVEGEEQHNNQLEIGVFDGTVCRGTAMASTVISDRYYAFISVFGINGSEYTFKVYDHTTNTELDMSCEQTFDYQDNASSGTIGSPFVINFLYNHIVINVSANPTTSGTVTGGGTYDRNDLVTLTATPNTGSVFEKWTKADVQVSTNATYSFNATKANEGDYVAQFKTATYTITATANPTAGGSVTGGGTFNHGASCTLTASPATGYHFVNWTKGGTSVSTEDTYTFTVTEAGDYVANFEMDSFTITVAANPTAGGTVSGGGTFIYGQEATLIAVANEGYTFTKWTKGGTQVSTAATYTFSVTEGGDYVAVFTLNSYTITVAANPTTGGTVSGGGTYNHGQEVTLVATPAEGYEFTNWTKDGSAVSTAPTYVFSATAAGDYVANFTLKTYEITATADPVSGGTITGAGVYNHGANCTLVASPNTGCSFVKWTKDGADYSTEPSISFSVTAAASFVAYFNMIGYEVSATANPTEGGTISGVGSYTYGQTCDLVATPNEGYTFVKWTKNGTDYSTEPSISFTVEESVSFEAFFNLNSYGITVTADPTAGGTVSGAGTYNHGTTATLTAEANTGYTFTKWTKDGAQVSTEATYTFTVTGAGDYVAVFTLNSYTITVAANPTEGGTVSGGGTYTHGQEVTLVATPAVGYTFTNWTKDGSAVSTAPTYVFSANAGGDYVANFTLKTYEITATADPVSGGTITGAGVYNHGETCILTATPNTGCYFVKWTKDGADYSTDNTIDFSVTAAASFVAHFTLIGYEVSAMANPADGGTITGMGGYDYGTTATLTATANMGYAFVNWTVGGSVVSTNPTYSFTVTGDISLVANFMVNSFAIYATASPAEGGTVTGAGTFNYGETCTLTATPNTGYTFVNWTKEDVVVSSEATINFEVTAEATYVAHFILKSYSITVAANPTAGGTVTGAGTYNHFATATLTATAATGYTFVNWTKDGSVVSTNATYSFTVEGAGNYVANFTLNSYDITVTANPTAGGTVTGAGTYNHGATATLTATAATGYTFANWTKDGSVVSTNATYSFTVEGAGNYVANFTLNSYAITVTANPTAGGIVTGAGTYNHGATATLTATASTGYTFVNWTKDGTEVSTNATYSFTVEGAGSYVANFSLNSYTITATANPTAGGSIAGAGTYNHFETCTLTATAATGYTFVNWTKEGTVVSTDPSISFTVEGPATYVANFSLNSYEITATANPATFGTVSGGGTYNHFESCTLTATPAHNYYFINWTKNGVEVSTSQTYTFTVTEAGDYVANFSPGYVEIIAYASQADFGTVEGGGSYLVGSTCTLTAIPYEGFIFSKWAKGTQVVSTDAVYSFEVTDGGTYRALFEREPYYITAEANPAEGGTITGTGGTFYNNTSCQLIATANEGYNFLNWTKDGAVVSTNYIYQFNVTGSAHFVANFELVTPPTPETVEITAEADPAEGGTVTGAGTYEVGATVTMTAVANTDYRFVNWTVGGEVITDAASFSFIATGDVHLVAHFISTVGVNDWEELPISVYPNPTVDKLFVESPVPVRQCEVYSISGQRLLLLEDCGETFEIQVHHLPSGSYVIRLTSGNAVGFREFIKK